MKDIDVGIVLDIDGSSIRDIWYVPLKRVIEVILFQNNQPQDEKSLQSGQLFYMDELHSLHKKGDIEHFRQTLINLAATLDDFKKIFKPEPKKDVYVIVGIDTRPVIKSIRVKETTFTVFNDLVNTLRMRFI